MQTTDGDELSEFLDELFRANERVSGDEIYRRAVAAELPAETLTTLDSLPDGEYAADEVQEALRLLDEGLQRPSA